MTLFRKAAFFTDIHFGKKMDSEEHNLDCLRYLQWFLERVRDHECDVIFFLGDWFENQIRTENSTNFHSDRGIRMLSAAGVPIYWLIGNHDIYFKNHRQIHSIPHADRYPNITLINEVTLLGEVLMCPWPRGDEFAKIPDIKCKYTLGHFELPTFLMNQSRLSDDNGGLHGDHFYLTEWVFSGHFHKRQTKTNVHGIPITYIGNTFPHDFNDLNDNERGMMILEWGGLPQYESWPDAPNFHRMKVSELGNLLDLENGLARFNSKSVLECLNDLRMSDDSMNDLNSFLGIRKFIPLDQPEAIIEEHEDGPARSYASFDDLVIDNLRKLDTNGRYQTDILVDLYRNA